MALPGSYEPRTQGAFTPTPGAQPYFDPATPLVQPPTPPRKRRTGLFVGLVVAVVVVLGGGGVAIAAVTAGGSKPTPAVAASSWHQPPAVVVPAPTYADPVAADFVMAPKVTKKDCFGSAGCNITFSVVLTYNGGGVKPDSSWAITYDVLGGNDPQTNTLTLNFDGTGQHGQYSQDAGQLIQTPRSSSVLTIKVTAISPG